MGYGLEPTSVDEAVRALTETGLLSDARFAASYVRSRVERGYGPLRIRQELRQRAIDEDLIGHSLDRYASEWFSRAATARRKRFGATLPDTLADRARQSRFLQYRGFTSEQVGALLDARDSD